MENNESGKVRKLIERDALIILESYSGANNYILYLQDKQSNNPRFLPTRSQSDYIVKYSETIPKIGRRWVDMDPYFAKKIANENGMIEIPKQVWVEKLLVEKEKSYHIWAKYNEKDKLKDMWMPKGALLKTHTIEEVDIDYSKYSHRPPLNHQLEAIEKLVGSKRFILADDMGLGKTTATIIAALETGVKKILIICPASLKLNWQREIENYTDRSIYIAEGKKFSTEHDFVIVNYDILKNFYDIKDKENSLITKSGFDVIILDEAHYVSNGQAKRTKLVNSFCKNPKYLWLLTGTPMTNRPMNYFNLLNLIESPVSQNWMAYAIRYCQGYQFTAGNRKIWNVSGASNLEELRDRTSRQVLWYDRNQEERKSLTVQFSKLMKVRQIIADEKVKNTIELAENILEQGKKVIIFTNFTNSLNKITEHFKKKAVKLDGSSTKPSRQKAVDDFQEKDKIQVFVGNTKAAGVGITLTAGEAVIFNDISFVPGDMEQAEDRAYRYGQKNSVSVYYPLFENTIESVIYDMVNFKKQNIQTVMGDNLDTGDFVEVLMNKINNLR